MNSKLFVWLFLSCVFAGGEDPRGRAWTGKGGIEDRVAPRQPIHPSICPSVHSGPYFSSPQSHLDPCPSPPFFSSPSPEKYFYQQFCKYWYRFLAQNKAKCVQPQSYQVFPLPAKGWCEFFWCFLGRPPLPQCIHCIYDQCSVMTWQNSGQSELTETRRNVSWICNGILLSELFLIYC